jgi:hypothetical protein
VVPQVHDGGSSDGQALYNTGLLPISSGAAAGIFKDNNYPSLLKALATRSNLKQLKQAPPASQKPKSAQTLP